MSASPEHPDVKRLRRWADAGGEWRVIARTPTRVAIALLTCDGGEEMAQIVSADAEVAEYVTVFGNSVT